MTATARQVASIRNEILSGVGAQERAVHSPRLQLPDASSQNRGISTPDGGL